MDPEQELAASRMAAAQKGKKARQDAREQKEAASKVAAMQRGRSQRKEADDKKKAAVAIQARQRGKRERGQAEKAGQRYYTPAEVAAHNRADDLWVSSFNRVYDLTALVASNPGHLVQPIVDAAGTDITHWFDTVTKEVCTYIDPETELEAPFTPMGAFLHCPPAMPTADWNSNIGAPPRPGPTQLSQAQWQRARPPRRSRPGPHPCSVHCTRLRALAGKPWWKDRSYMIGMLTAKTRKITLYNMLTKSATTLEVCSEETLEEIQRRYLKYNGHSPSYTWKRTDQHSVARLLNMRATLDANGIPDEDMAFDALNIDPDAFIPIIHLYFADDLTEA
jgi:cytochrome b involved in lipid metabolism